MTQNEEILEILKERPINSFERFKGQIFAGQLPRCIWDLENRAPWNLKGKIIHKDLKDGSTTYILRNTSQGGSDSQSAPSSLSPQGMHFCGNTARMYPASECSYCQPVQEVLI